METMTMPEIAKAISEHFGGNKFLTRQGILSFLDEFGDLDPESGEDGYCHYPVEIVQEWLAR
jgi:hypothetical protein